MVTKIESYQMKREEVPSSWLGLGEDPEGEDCDDEIEEEETLGPSLSINCLIFSLS
jgi:hypothetical protein